MRKWITIILTVVMIISCSIPALAVEVSDQMEISVNAKAVYNIEGEYSVNIENDGAAVTVDGNITVTVTDAPKGVVRLIVTPIPTSEKEAWSWITGCLKYKGTPIHAFDIYFADESGKRINADGAVVTIDCPHCTEKPMVCSLTTSGEVKELSNNARSVSVTFTTDGSHYYVMTEKVYKPTGDGIHNTDTPQTGDKIQMELWLALLLVSGGLLTVKGVYGKKKKQSAK